MASPQTHDVTNPEPIWSVNAKWVNGVAPGYWPTAGTGLTLDLSAGSANNAGTIVNYAGGTLALADNTTNYVYLDPAASYAPASNTTGFTASVVPIATVVTASGAITSITDNRLAASAGGGTPGGTNHQTQINSSGAFAGIATGTAGQYYRSGGASADPAFASIAESEVAGLTSDLAGKVPTSRLISTTAPLTGGGDLSADRTLAISNFTGDSGSGGAKGAVPAPAAGDAAAGKFLKADGTWAVPPTTTLPNFADAEVVSASGTAATLAHTPNPTASLILVVDGQVLKSGAGNDYTLSTATIAFATAPRVGANIQAWYRY